MKSCEEVVYRSSWCDVNYPLLSDWSKDGGRAWARSGRSSSPMTGIRSGRLLELLAVSCGIDGAAASKVIIVVGSRLVDQFWLGDHHDYQRECGRWGIGDRERGRGRGRFLRGASEVETMPFGA